MVPPDTQRIHAGFEVTPVPVTVLIIPALKQMPESEDKWFEDFLLFGLHITQAPLRTRSQGVGESLHPSHPGYESSLSMVDTVFFVT